MSFTQSDAFGSAFNSGKVALFARTHVYINHQEKVTGMIQRAQRPWFAPALAQEEKAEQHFPLEKEEMLALQAALETGRYLPRSFVELIALTFELTPEEVMNPIENYSTYGPFLLPYGGPFAYVFGGIARNSETFLTQTFPEYLHLARDVVVYSTRIEQRYEEMDQLAQQAINAPDAAQRRPPFEQLQLLLQMMYDEIQPFALHAAEVEQQTTLLTRSFEESQELLETRQREYSNFIRPSSGMNSLVEEGKTLQTRVVAFNATYQQEVTHASQQAHYQWVEPLGVLATPTDTQRASEGQRYMQEMMRLMQAYYNAANIERAKAIANLATHKTELLMSSVSVDVAVAVPAIQKLRGLWTALQQDIAVLQAHLEENLDEENWRLIDAEVRQAILQWKDLGQQAQRYLDIATIQVT